MYPSADGVEAEGLDALRAEVSSDEYERPESAEESSMPGEAVIAPESRPSDARITSRPPWAISRSRASAESPTRDDRASIRAPSSQPRRAPAESVMPIDTRSGLIMRVDMGEVSVRQARTRAASPLRLPDGADARVIDVPPLLHGSCARSDRNHRGRRHSIEGTRIVPPAMGVGATSTTGETSEAAGATTGTTGAARADSAN